MTQTKKDAEQTIDMEAFKAQLLEEAKTEAEKIIAEAKKEAKTAAEKAVAEAVKKPEPYRETEEEIAKANELVTIRLFKDAKDYKDDVLVIINGESYLIKRGVEVEIPRKVFDVIKCSDAQTAKAADYILGKQEEFEEKKADYL